MFPIFATAVAIVICLVGLEVNSQAGQEELNPLTASILMIIPLGEILIFIAKKRAASFGFRASQVLFRIFSVLPIACFAVAVFFFRITAISHSLGAGDWPLVDKLVLMASYVAISNGVRIYRFRFARAIRFHAPAYSKTGLMIAFRGELTVLIPFLVFMLFHDLITLNEKLDTYFTHLPALFWLVLMAMFLGLIYTMPDFIRWLWRLHPIPAGTPIRQELLEFMKSLRFTAKDILVWNTKRLIMNAAILGFLPRSRYILFTDTLLQGLTTLEIKAVFAHEIGHGRKKHITLYLFFSFAFIFGLAVLESLVPPLIRIEERLDVLLPCYGVVVVLYWWIVFGFLSRRFEMEADIFGAHAVKNPSLFIHTLSRVASIGGVEKRKGSWRHFSIERRMISLKKIFLIDPVSAFRFFRKMTWIKRILITMSLLVSLLFAWHLTVDTVAGIGSLAAEKGDFETGQKYLDLACNLPMGRIHQWTLL
ncbi:MAG: M48 family metallopeptidase, partial [Planctomycetota bacterium]